MYVTSHHVRTSLGVIGVNTLLHRHDFDEVDGIGTSIDFDWITQHFPGRLAAVDFQVSLGVNAVLAYLDVICAILPTVVGEPLEHIARLGGVQVVSVPRDRVSWEWPRRSGPGSTAVRAGGKQP